MKHGGKTWQAKSSSSIENGLLLSCHVLCVQQRNNPINGNPIRADPEAVHALEQNFSHNNWHFAITLYDNYRPMNTSTIQILIKEMNAVFTY